MKGQMELVWGDKLLTTKSSIDTLDKIEWKEYLLGDLGRVVTGNTPSKNNPEEWGELIPFITPSDYKNYHKKAFESIRMLSKIGANRFVKKILPPNSILVTCIGFDMGKVIMNGVDAVTNQQINSLIPNTELVDNDFLYYNLVGLHETLTLLGSDSTIVRILNKSDFENITTRIPPLLEQRAIASVLSSFDDKIDLLHRQNATLEALAETLFRQWFVEEAHEEWEEKSLSGIATFLNGLACQKYLPKNELDKLPVLKIKELRNGFADDHDWATTDVKEEYIVENGDVIFAWSASLMVKIWDGEKCVLNQHLFKVTSDKYPKWFFYYWCKLHLQNFISISESHATTMGHIKRGDLDEAVVVVPSKAELSKIDEAMTPLLDKVISNNIKLRTLSNLRDTLLPKLMSGEVRVKLK